MNSNLSLRKSYLPPWLVQQGQQQVLWGCAGRQPLPVLQPCRQEKQQKGPLQSQNAQEPQEQFEPVWVLSWLRQHELVIVQHRFVLGWGVQPQGEEPWRALSTLFDNLRQRREGLPSSRSVYIGTECWKEEDIWHHQYPRELLRDPSSSQELLPVARYRQDHSQHRCLDCKYFSLLIWLWRSLLFRPCRSFSN